MGKRGCGMLVDQPANVPIRLYCPDCHRGAQFRVAGLLKRFGTEQDMPGLLARLRPCDRNSSFGPQCRLLFWDRMDSELRRAALAKGGLPAGWTAE
jgi:hypothetical protein